MKICTDLKLGINELELIEYADLVVINSETVKYTKPSLKEFNKYDEDIIIAFNNSDIDMYVGINRYTINYEILSVKIICTRERYNSENIHSILSEIISYSDYKIDLTVL